MRLFSQRRGSVCALCVSLNQATHLFLLSYASRTGFAVDEATNDLPRGWYTRRSDQKQSRTAGGKRAAAATTHHLVPTDQATGVQKDGPASPGAPGEDGPDLEAGARPGPTRDPSTLAPGAFPRVLEAQIQGALKKVEDFARDHQLDQGNGSQQSALGSRTYPWRVT